MRIDRVVEIIMLIIVISYSVYAIDENPEINNMHNLQQQIVGAVTNEECRKNCQKMAIGLVELCNKNIPELRQQCLDDSRKDNQRKVKDCFDRCK
jgi:hypothetical protein